VSVSGGKTGARRTTAAFLFPPLGNPYSSAVLLGELRRNSCICLSAAKFSKHFPHTMSLRYSIGIVALHTSSITLKSQLSGEPHTLHVLRLIGAIVLESGTSISLTCRMVHHDDSIEADRSGGMSCDLQTKGHLNTPLPHARSSDSISDPLWTASHPLRQRSQFLIGQVVWNSIRPKSVASSTHLDKKAVYSLATS